VAESNVLIVTQILVWCKSVKQQSLAEGITAFWSEQSACATRVALHMWGANIMATINLTPADIKWSGGAPRASLKGKRG
jgi:hypothetical protein